MDLDAKYQHKAVTDTKVAPDLVDPEVYGHHISRVEDGVRHWGFDTELGRDHFQRDVDNGFFQRTHK